MTAVTPITLDTKKLNDALARFPRDRAMQIGGREVLGGGETIERRSPAHGVVVTRVPRGRAEDARGCNLDCAKGLRQRPVAEGDAPPTARACS